jgi:iron-sulfur cluster assembly protein
MRILQYTFVIAWVGLVGCSRTPEPDVERASPAHNSKPVVALTEAAANELKSILAKIGPSPNGIMFRVSAKRQDSGGFFYMFEMEPAANYPSDLQFQSHGLTLVVDKELASSLKGTVIDFEERPEKRGFVFHNPNDAK